MDWFTGSKSVLDCFFGCSGTIPELPLERLHFITHRLNAKIRGVQRVVSFLPEFFITGFTVGAVTSPGEMHGVRVFYRVRLAAPEADVLFAQPALALIRFNLPAKIAGVGVNGGGSFHKISSWFWMR